MGITRCMRALALATLPLVLSGCGGDSGTRPTPVATPAPTPPPPVTTVVAEGSYSGLKKNFIVELRFTTTASGTLRAIVDWTFAEDHMILYLAQGACSFEQLRGGQCNLVALSETTTPKPRELVVSNAAAGPYVLWIGNLGPKQESFSYRVLLTTGGSASSAAVAARPARVGGLMHASGP